MTNQDLLPKKEKIPSYVIFILYGVFLMISSILGFCSVIFSINMSYSISFIVMTLAINFILIERMIHKFNQLVNMNLYILESLTNNIAYLEAKLSDIENEDKNNIN